jgi:hypothetical protein
MCCYILNVSNPYLDVTLIVESDRVKETYLIFTFTVCILFKIRLAFSYYSKPMLFEQPKQNFIVFSLIGRLRNVSF